MTDNFLPFFVIFSPSLLIQRVAGTEKERRLFEDFLFPPLPSPKVGNKGGIGGGGQEDWSDRFFVDLSSGNSLLPLLLPLLPLESLPMCGSSYPGIGGWAVRLLSFS